MDKKSKINYVAPTKKWLVDLWNYRELLLMLVKREVKIRYKQTTLGVFWAILQPLSLMLIFTFIFGFVFKVQTKDVPYPIFAYSALLPWIFFSTSFSFGSSSLINNSNLITKVFFPREILPLSSIGAAFLDFAIASLIFLVMLFYYKIPFTLNLLFIPLIIGSLIVFTCAVTLFFSGLIVIWRDLKFVIPLILQVWLFATPVFYSYGSVPDKYIKFYFLNPLAPLIENFRLITVFGQYPNLKEIGTAVSFSLVIFIFSYIFFKSMEKKFADII